MNEKAAIFKPDPVEVELAPDYKVTLVYDLNALCELEKIYDSIDQVIQMILGTNEDVDVNKLMTQVKCGDQFIEGKDVTIAGTPLMKYLTAVHVKQARMTDTLNLLWAGTLHDNAKYDENDELIGYTVSKHKLGSYVTFRNMRVINAAIVTAILRDLVPAKNVTEPAAPQEAPAQDNKESKEPVRLHLADHSDK